MAEARKLVREIEEEAHEKGIQKGQKFLVLDTIKSRLKRSLTSEEVSAFHAHFEAIGAIALNVHIGGLDSAALAAWLAQPPQS